MSGLAIGLYSDLCFLKVVRGSGLRPLASGSPRVETPITRAAALWRFHSLPLSHIFAVFFSPSNLCAWTRGAVMTHDTISCSGILGVANNDQAHSLGQGQAAGA